jgi:DNA-binding NtrC family response regulator
VVDDDPTILEFLEGFLKDQGAEVVTSDFPANIADLMREAQPDVLLLDILSPDNGLAGLIILGRLYGSTLVPPPPVLLMSADEVWLSALKERAEELGIGLVPKPFDFDRLWLMIEQAVSH